jgi:hypothetical protein
VHCQAGEHKHELAEEHLTKTLITEGLFLILVGRAQAPVWDITTNHHHIEPKRPMPYVNHYSFHILDPEWGHLTIKISSHPPFPAEVILNGHEYVACSRPSRPTATRSRKGPASACRSAWTILKGEPSARRQAPHRRNFKLPADPKYAGVCPLQSPSSGSPRPRDHSGLPRQRQLTTRGSERSTTYRSP